MGKIRNSWHLPYPVQIVFLRNHFHAGGINMTTWTGGWSCTSHSTYDRNADLVEISTCTANSSYGSMGMQTIPRGAEIFVESFYQQDHLPHYGVMSMSFVYVHVPSRTNLIV